MLFFFFQFAKSYQATIKCAHKALSKKQHHLFEKLPESLLCLCSFWASLAPAWVPLCRAEAKQCSRVLGAVMAPAEPAGCEGPQLPASLSPSAQTFFPVGPLEVPPLLAEQAPWGICLHFISGRDIPSPALSPFLPRVTLATSSCLHLSASSPRGSLASFHSQVLPPAPQPRSTQESRALKHHPRPLLLSVNYFWVRG